MKKFRLIFMLLLIAASAALYIYCTPNGVGLTNDSAAYIGGARSLIAGTGYARIGGDRQPRPITQFPPLYSLVIAGVSKLTGLDALKAVWRVNLVLSVVNAVLFYTLLLRITKQTLPAVLGGIAFLCCGPVLTAHIYGLSEILFLTLFFIILHVSLRAMESKQGGIRWLLCGLLCGALMLTRYAALSVIAGCCLCALVFPKGWKARLMAFFQTAFGFIVPTFYLIRRNDAVSESGGVNRAIAFHMPAADKLKEGVINFTGFFLPEFGGWIEKVIPLLGILILIGLLLLLLAVGKSFLDGFLSKRTLRAGLFMTALHAAIYIVMLILDALFIDGSTVFDNRMLLPFFVLAVLFIYIIFGELLRSRKTLWKGVAVLAMVGFALLLAEDEIDLVREYHQDGQGFAGSEWSESETRMGALKLGQEVTLFSNRQTYLGLMNNQPSYILPPMFNAANFADRENFEAERQWMSEEVLSGKAYVVVFNYPEMMQNAEDSEWLNTVLAGLPVKAEYSDGAIFGR